MIKEFVTTINYQAFEEWPLLVNVAKFFLSQITHLEGNAIARCVPRSGEGNLDLVFEVKDPEN